MILHSTAPIVFAAVGLPWRDSDWSCTFWIGCLTLHDHEATLFHLCIAKCNHVFKSLRCSCSARSFTCDQRHDLLGKHYWRHKINTDLVTNTNYSPFAFKNLISAGGYAPPLSEGRPTVLCTHKRDIATVTLIPGRCFDRRGGGGIGFYNNRGRSQTSLFFRSPVDQKEAIGVVFRSMDPLRRF